MAGEIVCSSGFADHISERRQGDGELPRRGGRRRAVAIKRYVAVLQGIDGDIGAERRVRGVEGEQDFLPRRRVDARHGEQPRLFGIAADALLPAPKRDMILPQLREPGEGAVERIIRSEEHTSELQSIMRISYAVLCLKQKKTTTS